MTKKFNPVKTLKLSTSDINNSVLGLISAVNEYGEKMLDNEARELAQILTGTNTGSHIGQGMRTEMTHFSGLQKRANDYLKSRTHWTVKEVRVHGDGFSTYIIK